MKNKLLLVHLQLCADEAKTHNAAQNKVKSRFFVHMANNLMQLFCISDSQRKETAHV